MSRHTDAFHAHQAGETYVSIGQRLNVSTQRAHQLCARGRDILIRAFEAVDVITECWEHPEQKRWWLGSKHSMVNPGVRAALLNLDLEFGPADVLPKILRGGRGFRA